jgi:hypothetical protein
MWVVTPKVVPSYHRILVADIGPASTQKRPQPPILLGVAAFVPGSIKAPKNKHKAAVFGF